MAKRLESGEELHLLVSPKSRHLHQGYGPDVFYITYPWSNERRNLRTLSEHLYSPVRLPLSRIDVFNTLMAPVVNFPWSLVLHFKTMHAYTAPDAIRPLPRLYRRMNYPRSARVADAIIINSESLRSEIQRYLEVDPAQAQADLRSGRPRPVPAGRRRRGAGASSRRTASPSRSCSSCPRCGRTRTATDCCGRGRWRAVSSGTASWRSSAPGGTRSTWPRCTRSRPSLVSPEDVVFVGAIPLEADRQLLPGRGRSSSTRHSTRPSGCPFSRPWPAAARS